MSFLTTFPEEVYPTQLATGGMAAVSFAAADAQACMWLAQLAYEVSSASVPTARLGKAVRLGKAARILERWGLAPLAWLSRGGIEGFVADAPSCLVVSFAGTDPVVAANWVTDFDIRIGPEGLHRGFADAIDVVWEELVAAVARSRKPVVVVGHSLGGALAVIAAWRLGGGGPSAPCIARVVTFGAPRAGNEAFAASYRQRSLWDRTLRLHHGSDIVPFVPPAAAGALAYRHVGSVLRCRRGAPFDFAQPPTDASDGPMTLSDLAAVFAQSDLATIREWRLAWSRLTAERPGIFPAGGAASVLVDTLPFFLRDHLQDCYLEALGWAFDEPASVRMIGSTDELGMFLRGVRDRIDVRFASLAGMMQGWLGGG